MEQTLRRVLREELRTKSKATALTGCYTALKPSRLYSTRCSPEAGAHRLEEMILGAGIETILHSRGDRTTRRCRARASVGLRSHRRRSSCRRLRGRRLHRRASAKRSGRFGIIGEIASCTGIPSSTHQARSLDRRSTDGEVGVSARRTVSSSVSSVMDTITRSPSCFSKSRSRSTIGLRVCKQHAPNRILDECLQRAARDAKAAARGLDTGRSRST